MKRFMRQIFHKLTGGQVLQNFELSACLALQVRFLHKIRTAAGNVSGLVWQAGGFLLACPAGIPGPPARRGSPSLQIFNKKRVGPALRKTDLTGNWRLGSDRWVVEVT